MPNADYVAGLAALEAFYAKKQQETDAAITGLVHSYELPTRDLCALLIPLFKALAPK